MPAQASVRTPCSDGSRSPCGSRRACKRLRARNTARLWWAVVWGEPARRPSDAFYGARRSARVARPPRSTSSPRTSAGRGTSRPGGLFRTIDAGAVGVAPTRTRSRCSARSSPPGIAELAATTRASSPTAERAARRPAPLPHEAALVPEPRERARIHRLLLARVRDRRGPAAVLGRPRHPRGRPPRSRPATSACRSSASALFYRAGYFRQAISREGWQQESYPVLDPDGLPRRRAAAPRRHRRAGRARAARGQGAPRAQVWRVSVGRVHAAAARHRHPENADVLRGVTDRLYGGGGRAPPAAGAAARHRRRARGRAVRGAERRAAPEVFHTNEGHAGFLGLERIADLIGEAGLSFQEALQVARAGTVVHHPHARCRPASTASTSRLIERVLLDRPAAGRRRSRTSWRSAPRTTRAATPRRSTWPSWACGSRSARTASRSCTARCPARCSASCGRASTPTTCRSPPVTNGVHAPTWVDPDARRPLEGRRSAPRTPRRPTGPSRPGAATRTSGPCGARCASSSSADARRRLGRRWPEQNPARRRAGLVRRGARPRRAHDRVRPARAHLQAAHAHAARPGAADVRSCCTPSARCRS